MSSRLIHAVVCPPFFRLSLPGHHATFCLPVFRLSICLSVGTWVAQPWLPSLALSARQALRGVPSGLPWCGWLLPWHPCLAVGLCAHAPYSRPLHGRIYSRPCLHFSSFSSSPLDRLFGAELSGQPFRPNAVHGSCQVTAWRRARGSTPAGSLPELASASGVLNPCKSERQRGAACCFCCNVFHYGEGD